MGLFGPPNRYLTDRKYLCAVPFDAINAEKLLGWDVVNILKKRLRHFQKINAVPAPTKHDLNLNFHRE